MNEQKLSWVVEKASLQQKIDEAAKLLAATESVVEECRRSEKESEAVRIKSSLN